MGTSSNVRWLSKEGRAELSLDQLKEARAYVMYYNAKQRAKEQCMAFDLEVWDIETPDECPVFKVALAYDNEGRKDNSPTLDRVKPELGYVKGNVRTICWRANRLKNNGSLREFEAIVSYLKGS